MGICLYVYGYTYITCHHWHRKSFVIHSTLTHWCLGDIVCLQYMYCYEVSFAICNIMDQRIRRLQNPPKTFQELTNTLVEVRQDIDLGTIHRLIRSIPRRCITCITARGGHTRYWCVLSIWLNKWSQFWGKSISNLSFCFFDMISGLYRQMFFSPFALANLAHFCYR